MKPIEKPEDREAKFLELQNARQRIEQGRQQLETGLQQLELNKRNIESQIAQRAEAENKIRLNNQEAAAKVREEHHKRAAEAIQGIQPTDEGVALYKSLGRHEGFLDDEDLAQIPDS